MRFRATYFYKNGIIDEQDYADRNAQIVDLFILSNIISLVHIFLNLTVTMLKVEWLKSKNCIYLATDIFNREFLGEILLLTLFSLVQPYWFLVGVTFTDSWNENSAEANLVFELNDAILFVTMIIKFLPIYSLILEWSSWTDPKASRCCQIFGVEPSTFFALKAHMKEDPVTTTVWAFVFSLLQLSISMQLFERHINENFQNITTAMWLVIITMTTVGYGDYYPRTNFGRLVGVITAFWGVFFVSLFVVALTNTLEPEESEMRAFILLRRLYTRNELRKSAARMI